MTNVSDVALKVLAFLSRNDLLVRRYHYGMSNSNSVALEPKSIGFANYEARRKNRELSVHDRAITVSHSVIEGLTNRGFLKSLNLDRYNDAHGTVIPKSMNTSVLGITKEGQKFLAEQKGRLDTLYAQDESAYGHERLVIVKAATRGSYHSGTIENKSRRAGELCQIIRETEARYYVQVIEEVQRRPDEYMTTSFVEGSRDKYYVAKDKILASDVTRAQYDAIRKSDEEYLSSMDVARAQRDEEMEPILKRFEDRKIQLQAMRDDELRELLGSDDSPEDGADTSFRQG
ncbi:hypothetical protein ACFOY8_12760 [Thalassospira xianhensis]|uniref:Uncharacterized protein n=1 Tax=Thalassospira xianhensis MCCC 1A02616 TaxID=1177929 RepID=A0A367UE48_9PROT|nr:hypothetical protein [Thalassospira xianhensis]RCK06281.1 hypothetical protein TH5_08670 [Thalassospira xianhensis MCCC 1A02616]